LIIDSSYLGNRSYPPHRPDIARYGIGRFSIRLGNQAFSDPIKFMKIGWDQKIVERDVLARIDATP
jgi:hypothetical protein